MFPVNDVLRCFVPWVKEKSIGRSLPIIFMTIFQLINVVFNFLFPCSGIWSVSAFPAHVPQLSVCAATFKVSSDSPAERATVL